jgi:hypothetical protein
MISSAIPSLPSKVPRLSNLPVGILHQKTGTKYASPHNSGGQHITGNSKLVKHGR